MRNRPFLCAYNAYYMRIISAYANAFLTHKCDFLKFLTSVETLMLTFEEIAKRLVLRDDLSIFDN